MSQALNLYRLQKIDSQLDQIRLRLNEIDRLLSTNPLLDQAKVKEAETSLALQNAKKALRQVEDLVQSQQIKIEQDEGALYGGKIKNPKELQDLQNEVASLKRYLKTLEDQQLEAMLALDECEEAHRAATAAVHEVEAKSISQRSSFVGEQAALRKEMDRLEAERRATIAPINESDVKIYDRLRHQKRGVAVTGVTDDACDACGSTLNKSEQQEARSPNHTGHCPNCGRILFIR